MMGLIRKEVRQVFPQRVRLLIASDGLEEITSPPPSAGKTYKMFVWNIRAEHEGLERSGARVSRILRQFPVSTIRRGARTQFAYFPGYFHGRAPWNLQQTVEIYVDEFPLTDRFSAWTSPDISTFDIERV